MVGWLAAWSRVKVSRKKAKSFNYSLWFVSVLIARWRMRIVFDFDFVLLKVRSLNHNCMSRRNRFRKRIPQRYTQTQWPEKTIEMWTNVSNGNVNLYILILFSLVIGVGCALCLFAARYPFENTRRKWIYSRTQRARFIYFRFVKDKSIWSASPLRVFLANFSIANELHRIATLNFFHQSPASHSKFNRYLNELSVCVVCASRSKLQLAYAVRFVI